MAISIDRLSGGNTPADGSDPRTFPAIWNATAAILEANVGEGGASVTVSETEPVSPTEGDLWLNSTEAKMYVYYNDGDSSQWVAAVGGTVPQQGKILQVVSATTTTETTISTDTLTDTTLKATITPSSTASKILVMCSLQTRSQRSTSAVTSDIAIDRAGTVVFQNFSRALGGSGSGTTTFAVDAYQSLNYLDSPSTTSATEYTILAAPGTTTSSGQVVVQSASQPSSIVLMEVAG